MNNAKILKKTFVKAYNCKDRNSEVPKKSKGKDTGSNHVVPVMLTFYDTDCKTVKERIRSRVCINSKEHENAISF